MFSSLLFSSLNSGPDRWTDSGHASKQSDSLRHLPRTGPDAANDDRILRLLIFYPPVSAYKIAYRFSVCEFLLHALRGELPDLSWQLERCGKKNKRLRISFAHVDLTYPDASVTKRPVNPEYPSASAVCLARNILELHRICSKTLAKAPVSPPWRNPTPTISPPVSQAGFPSTIAQRFYDSRLHSAFLPLCSCLFVWRVKCIPRCPLKDTKRCFVTQVRLNLVQSHKRAFHGFHLLERVSGVTKEI